MVTFMDNEVVSLNFYPVTYNKRKGRLYFTDQRIAYVFEGHQDFNVIIQHEDFKTQYATKDDKPPAKLKIECNDSSSFIFTFDYNGGLTDRNELKTKISQEKTDREKRQIIQKTVEIQEEQKRDEEVERVVINPNLDKDAKPIDKIEMKLRASLLAKNPKLAELHKALVRGEDGKESSSTDFNHSDKKGFISEEEFWETRKILLKDQEIQLKQQKAQSSAWLDLKPSGQDGNEIKYTITPEIIRDIFLQYPSIQKAYNENVPDKINEVEFWKRFFASKYFHWNRSNNKINSDKDDELFDPLLEQDNKEAEALAEKFKPENIPKVINLESNVNDHDIYGNQPDQTMRPGRSKNAINLIRRFNLHSDQILKNAKLSNSQPNKNIFKQELELEDLNKATDEDVIHLEVTDSTKMFGTLNETNNDGLEDDKIQNLENLAESFINEYKSEPLDLTNAKMRTKSANAAMKQINEDIELQNKGKSSNKRGRVELHEDILNKLKSEHSKANEILKHYWATVTDPGEDEEAREQKKSKRDRMIVALGKVMDSVHNTLHGLRGKGNEKSSQEAKSYVRSLYNAHAQAISSYNQ